MAASNRPSRFIKPAAAEQLAAVFELVIEST
jgi:hypothetical protein